jgi:membrane protease YdiL (CAAX protease family)
MVGVTMALVLIGVYYPIFLHYFSDIVKRDSLTLYRIFLDVVWYPVYEEITYRSFTLTHFGNLHELSLSTRNLTVNVTQTLLFLSIHKQYVSLPLVFVPVFCLAFLTGILFIRTRNIFGCIVSHSLLNGFALLLRTLQR